MVYECIRNQDYKARQVTKIKELEAALTASGVVTLDEQARALGLSRSSAWAILKANHKSSGLSAASIKRMLSSPELPARVRVTICTRPVKAAEMVVDRASSIMIGGGYAAAFCWQARFQFQGRSSSIRFAG
jgi:hypothetical protein